MLVSDLLDRTYSEWLEPAGIGRPTFDVLDGGISDTGLSILTEGRVSNIPDDTIVEIGSELILVKSVLLSTITAAERGYLETDAVAHSSGERVYVDPAFPRKVLFNTMNILLSDLWAQKVYQKGTDSSKTYLTAGTIALPAATKRIISVLINPYTSYTRYKRLVKGRDYEFYPEFSPPIIQMLGGGAITRPLTITYAYEIDQATDEDDDLDDLGVPEGLQPHVPLGIAGRLLMGREIPRTQMEEIRRLLSAQSVPVGQTLGVGQQLYNVYRTFVLSEAQALREAEEGTIEVVQ